MNARRHREGPEAVGERGERGDGDKQRAARIAWTVERNLGWLMNHRRLARDYEAKPHRSEAMVHLAMINLMTRRVTAESTPSWRGT